MYLYLATDKQFAVRIARRRQERSLGQISNTHTDTACGTSTPFGYGIIHYILAIKVVDIGCPHSGFVYIVIREIRTLGKHLAHTANPVPVEQIGRLIPSHTASGDIYIEFISHTDHRGV